MREAIYSIIAIAIIFIFLNIIGFWETSEIESEFADTDITQGMQF